MFRKVAAALFAASIGLMAGSIVKNGFFDDGNPPYGALPPSWTMEKPAEGGWGYANDDGVDGATSVRFTAVKGAGALMQNIKLQPETDYTLLFWYKCDGVAPSIAVKDGANSDVVRFSASDATFGKWQNTRQNFRSGKGTDYRLILEGDYNGIGKGRSCFDSIEILPRAEAAKRPEPVQARSEDNIALHKKYTIQKDPDYGFCKDPDDAVQLTDGGKTVGYFWTQKTTVGWHRNKPAIVIVDLEKTEPIGGASWSCAAGVAGVFWPSSIWVLTSDDMEHWNLMGDLTQFGVRGTRAPKDSVYEHFTYATRDFKGKGRYVAFVGMAPPCSAIFCDEVEVYRGGEEILAKPSYMGSYDAKDGKLEAIFSKTLFSSLIRKRLLLDIDELRGKVNGIPDKFAEKKTALDEIKACEAELEKIPLFFTELEDTVLPMKQFPVFARLYAVNGFIQRAKGFSKPFVWKSERWRNVKFTDNASSDKEKVRLGVTMMRGEVRSDAFSIANPTNEPKEFFINTTAVNQALGLRMFQAVMTDTMEGIAISSALKELPIDGGKAKVVVPAGCNVQVWLMCYKPTATAGKYAAAVKVVGAKNPSVRFDVEIVGIDFPKNPQLNVGGWEYAGNYNPKNRLHNIDFMREIGVNSTWAVDDVLPRNPSFDAEGRLTNADKLDFSRFDKWIGEWPNAHHYCVTHTMNRSQFFGEKAGTPRYERMVMDYYKAVEGHMPKLELKPEQLVYLYHDEPSTLEGDKIVVDFLSVTKKANLKMQFFQDPIWTYPENGMPEAFSLPNILCPNTPMMTAQGKSFKEFYSKQREAGRTLWLYSCSGPAKLLDPLHYWRGQAWQCHQMKAFGSFFWAFGCTARSGESWNAYAKNATEFGPYFVEREGTPTDSKQAEAVRESVADFEYMKMLEAEITRVKAANPKHPALAEAEKALAEAPSEIVSAITPSTFSWSAEKDYGLFDRNAVRLLKALEKLKK